MKDYSIPTLGRAARGMSGAKGYRLWGTSASGGGGGEAASVYVVEGTAGAGNEVASFVDSPTQITQADFAALGQATVEAAAGVITVATTDAALIAPNLALAQAAGVPMILGFHTVDNDHPAEHLGLCDNSNLLRADNLIDHATSHAISAGYETSDVTLYSDNSSQNHSIFHGTFVGTRVYDRDAWPGQGTIIAVPAATARLTTGSTVARTVIFGPLREIGFSLALKEVLVSALAWAGIAITTAPSHLQVAQVGAQAAVSAQGMDLSPLQVTGVRTQVAVSNPS